MTSYIGTSEGNKQIKKMFFGTDSWKDSKSVYYGDSSGWIKLFSGVVDATPSFWFGPNYEIVNNPLTATYSYESTIINNSGKTWVGISTLFTAANSIPGRILGVRVRNNDNSTNWTVGTIDGTSAYTPLSGSWNINNRHPFISDQMNLINAIPNGGRLVIQVVLSAGNHSAGTSFPNNAWPSTITTARRSLAGTNVINGDTPTWQNGYSQPWTHLYIHTDPNEGGIRKIIVGGDSVTAQVVPLADSPATRREGYAYNSWQRAVSANIPLNVCSFGQGTDTLERMASHANALAPVLSGRMDWYFAQGWSYNGSPNSSASELERIQQTTSARSAMEAVGIRTGVIFMTPPGSGRNTGSTLTSYNNLLEYYQNSTNSNLINLSPAIASGVDPTIIDPIYSLDGVHVGISGSSVHGLEFFNDIVGILQSSGEL